MPPRDQRSRRRTVAPPPVEPKPPGQTVIGQGAPPGRTVIDQGAPPPQGAPAPPPREREKADPPPHRAGKAPRTMPAAVTGEREREGLGGGGRKGSPVARRGASERTKGGVCFLS